jgi:hypothetical protein
LLAVKKYANDVCRNILVLEILSIQVLFLACLTKCFVMQSVRVTVTVNVTVAVTVTVTVTVNQPSGECGDCG